MRPDHTESIDLVTVVAIAVLAYTIANVVHEGLGHGGAALLLGARPTMLNAIFFNYDESTVSRTAQRLISAGGSVANLLVGLPSLALAPRMRSTRWRYFLWLFAAVNILTAFGYLLYSGIGGIGDWYRVIEGFTPAILFRAGLTVAGAVLYFIVAPKLLMPPLDPFLGQDPAVRERRARTLSLIPYFAGGVALILAGILNPLGWMLVLISAAAASFGGTSLLAWYPAIPRAPEPGTSEPPLGIERSIGWIVAAAVVLFFFALVLGPGIGVDPVAQRSG
jgi:hypothetical protein